MCSGGISKKIFSDTTYWPVVWLVLRVYIGYQWLAAGWHKLFDPAWVNGGSALKGFWLKAVAMPTPPARAAITYDWYRDFLQFLLNGEHYTWFAKLITVGEVLVGISLIVGVLVGVAALTGAFMNFNFMLAGVAATNPVLFLASIILILARKTAGYLGVDYFLQPWLKKYKAKSNTDLPSP